MEQNAYVRIMPGAETAVMLIHGIVGTPNHFRDLIPLMDRVPEAWSVYNLLLDGHGKDVEDFSRTSMDKWESQVTEVFDALSRTHRRVILVGHSMGTLLCAELALRNPEKVGGMFLLAVPLRPWIRLGGLYRMLRLVFGFTDEDDPREMATLKACGVKPTCKLWKYIPWIPRYLELFGLIFHVEKKLSRLSVPTVAYQSEKDELVMNKSARILENTGTISVHRLSESTHFYYSPHDRQMLIESFDRFLEDFPRNNP